MSHQEDVSERGRNVRQTRVLFVEMAVGYGGSAKSLLELVGALSNDVHGILLSAFPLSAAEGHGSWIGCIQLSVPHRDVAKSSRAISYLSELRYQARWILATVRAARRFKVNLIHVNNGLSLNVAAILAARLLRIPVVVHQRGWEIPSKKLQIAKRLAIASPIIAISRAVREHLVIRHDIADSHVHQVYDVVDPPRERPAARSEHRSIRVGMHGMLTSWKGQLLLVKAAALQQQHSPGAIRYAIAGGTVPGQEQYVADIRAAIADADLEGVVELVGHTDDVYGFLDDIDISVHASLSPEPLGRVIVEAQLAGVCVVAADSGGASELISESCGVAFEPGNAESLANAIWSVATDAKRRKEVTLNGMLRAYDVFSSRTLASAVRDIYDQELRR